MTKSDKAEQRLHQTSPHLGHLSAQSVADHEFQRAWRAAFVQDILAPLRNQPTHPLPFEEVREKLRLGSHTYRGLRDVPLDQIVGSLARYHDFSRAFRPRRESQRQRRQSVMHYREWQDRQHIYTISFEEAAADWFDTVHAPMVEVIREQKTLEEFPGRTEADLVAYILRYRDELHREWLDIPSTPAPSLVDANPPEERREAEEPRRRSEQAAQEFVAGAHRDR